MNADMKTLIDTAQAMVAADKGLLAMDESVDTCNKRFASAGIPQTIEMRRAYRELLLSAPGLANCISGVILYDETIRQTRADGMPFVKVALDTGMLVGIKVDSGAKYLAAHPGEKVTEGLDRLRERLQAYAQMGAHFAKWRAVIAVDELNFPSPACIEAATRTSCRAASSNGWAWRARSRPTPRCC
jgi:fructose-bisphosphate aldolase class I